jgi:hypothetical protein
MYYLSAFGEQPDQTIGLPRATLYQLRIHTMQRQLACYISGFAAIGVRVLDFSRVGTFVLSRSL